MRQFLCGCLMVGAVLFLSACGGTGTDTENVIFPKLGSMKLDVKPNTNLALQISNDETDFCKTEGEVVECYAISNIEEEQSGFVLQGSLINSNGAPLANALIQLTPCGIEESLQWNYFLRTDSTGKFNYTYDAENCVSVEASVKEGAMSTAALAPKIYLNQSSQLEVEITNTVSVLGSIDLSQSFDAEQKFVVGLLGLSGTNRRIVLQNGDQFKFYDIPRDIQQLYFFPYDGASEKGPFVPAEGVQPVTIPLDQFRVDELKEIRVDFKEQTE